MQKLSPVFLFRASACGAAFRVAMYTEATEPPREYGQGDTILMPFLSLPPLTDTSLKGTYAHILSHSFDNCNPVDTTKSPLNLEFSRVYKLWTYKSVYTTYL